MKNKKLIFSGVAALVAVTALGTSAWAATTVQIGASGKTFASSEMRCGVIDPSPFPPVLVPVIDAGLFNPTGKTSATVLKNDVFWATVSAVDPSTTVELNYDPAHLDPIDNRVVVALSKKIADSYSFSVPKTICDNSRNSISLDGTLEYGRNSDDIGNSYATVSPGCALNPATGQVQPYVNLFDDSGAVLNISVNGVALTQLSASRPHTPVFLGTGQNIISAAVATVAIPNPPVDYYVREGACPLQ